MSPLLRNRTALLALACVVLVGVALIALAVVEPGADSVEGVVPEGSRLVAQRRVDGATVLLVRERERLQVIVAHKERGGWFATEVDPAPGDASASWVATRGDGPVPALTAVYGPAVGAAVTVEWTDGSRGEATVRPGEPFLVIREGHHRSVKVVMRGYDGAVVAEVAGP